MEEHGPRKMDGDVNPFTGEPIQKLDSSGWVDMHPTDLYKQLAVLEKRMSIAITLGKVEIVNQLKGAIEHLRSTISEAIKRESNRPVRKRPNTPDERRVSSNTFD